MQTLKCSLHQKAMLPSNSWIKVTGLQRIVVAYAPKHTHHIKARRN
jgi:hypothetical protein